jgi:hypothetical protein
MKFSADWWSWLRTCGLLCVALPVCALAGCAEDCTHSLGPAFFSPNGQWSATSKSSLCGGKVLALGSHRTEVVLARSKSNYLPLSAGILSAEGLNDGDVQIHWLSNYQLELTVPNHTDFSALMASYNGIDISVRFLPPDIDERRRWVTFRHAQEEWNDQMVEWDRRRQGNPATAGPPPKAPVWDQNFR